MAPKDTKKKNKGPAGGPKPKKKKKGLANLLEKGRQGVAANPFNPSYRKRNKQKLTEEQKKNVEKDATVMEKEDIPGSPHFRMVPKKSGSGTEIMEVKKGGLMEATKRLKAQGLRQGGTPKQKAKRRELEKTRRDPAKRSKKTLSPQERKELMDKIKRSKGKMTNPFVTLDSLGRPTMEAKKGGSVKKFPDLSGDGKVTMKDVLMGRGVIKKPKKKAMGGSMTLKGGKLKGVKDAPEERRRERMIQRRKRLSGAATGLMGAVKGVLKGAGKVAGRETFVQRRKALGSLAKRRKDLGSLGENVGSLAGRLAKRGYGIAKK